MDNAIYGKKPRPSAYTDITSSPAADFLRQKLMGTNPDAAAHLDANEQAAKIAALQQMVGSTDESRRQSLESAQLGQQQEQERDAQLDPNNPEDAEYLRNKAFLANKLGQR